MKKAICLLVFPLIGFSGCKKKTVDYPGTGRMKATIGTTKFESTDCWEANVDGRYTIEASTGHALIKFNIKCNNIDSTTYSFDTTQAGNKATCLVNGMTYTALSGSVTFASITPGVAYVGYFSLTCTDGTTVTDGVFTAAAQ
jgi:hypothetical protein